MDTRTRAFAEKKTKCPMNLIDFEFIRHVNDIPKLHRVRLNDILKHAEAYWERRNNSALLEIGAMCVAMDTEAIGGDGDEVMAYTLLHLGEVLRLGREKYQNKHWREDVDKMPLSERYTSMMRHLIYAFSTEALDKETGQPHVVHALCNAMMLWTSKGPDDRPVY